MQPDDYDRHRLVTGRNVLGVYLVVTPVAEDTLDHGRADMVRHTERIPLPWQAAHLTFGLSGPFPVPRAARIPRIRFPHVLKYGFAAN
jgi:hypothetical protein